MKHWILTAITWAVFWAASPAVAALIQFKEFSVDLPPGWIIYEEDITVAFVAEDKSATMVVTVEFTPGTSWEGMSAQELAQAYADELKGTPPEMEDNDPNYYSFDFLAPDGQEAEASIVVVGGRFYLITISGRHKDLAAMVESVLLSIM